MTPGGSDLGAVASRNADKLQLLSSMPPPGDPEALDEFLAKFVSKTSQVGGRLQDQRCHVTSPWMIVGTKSPFACWAAAVHGSWRSMPDAVEPHRFAWCCYTVML